MRIRTLLAGLLAFGVAACSFTPSAPERPTEAGATRPSPSHKGNEITLFALGLIDTGYRFGGKNPDAGLDCSGMVSYIYQRAAGLNVTGNAADIASKGRPIERTRLRPGDLVFFNTRNLPLSHVGVYIGDNRFVHAPSSNGRVRIDKMNAGYYAQRFETARTFFD